MAKPDWVVTEGGRKIAQGTHAEILAIVIERDPFITELRDGMSVDGLTIGCVPAAPPARSESERALRAFTSSLHKQIHDAADAAFRGQSRKAHSLLRLVHERLDHFHSRQKP